MHFYLSHCYSIAWDITPVCLSVCLSVCLCVHSPKVAILIGF